MKRNEVDVFDFIEETNHLMKNSGLFLVTKGKEGKANAMTIGWGFLGTMWRKPVFVVAVRYSRHTYRLLEDSESFTICLPKKDQIAWLDICGTESGLVMDKFQKLGMTAKEGIKVKAPFIDECPVHFECEIIYKDHLKPHNLNKEVLEEVYPNRDMHTLYYGEVKACFAINNADEKLAEIN